VLSRPGVTSPVPTGYPKKRRTSHEVVPGFDVHRRVRRGLRGDGHAAQAASAQQQKFITVGTGGVTGVYYPAGGAICRLVNK
jgi:hypothetical protein